MKDRAAPTPSDARPIEVRYFASLVDAVGQPSETVEVTDVMSVEELWRLLVERHPGLGAVRFRPLVACDQVYAGWDQRLGNVREVAFLPPVSGG